MDFYGRREQYGGYGGDGGGGAPATPGDAPAAPYGMSQVNIEGTGVAGRCRRSRR